MASQSETCSFDEDGQYQNCMYEFEKLPREFNLRPIDRIAASELSVDHFLREYHMKDVPVIITNYTDGWAMRRWKFDVLKEECGQSVISVFERVAAFFDKLKEDLKENINLELKSSFNITLSEAMEELSTKRSLKELIETFEVFEKSLHKIPSFNHLAHYFWPIEIHDKAILSSCLPMYKDLVYPKYIPRLPIQMNGVWDKFLHPRVFIAPKNSRAYPAHRHGQDEHSMLVMIQGRKHFVNWNWDQAPFLSRTDFGRTETGDTVFMANPFTRNPTSQPDLQKAWGWEGIAGEGEMLYVPRGIHIVHNIESVVAVGYVHQLDEKNDWDTSNNIGISQQDIGIPDFLKKVACKTLEGNEKHSSDAMWMLKLVGRDCR